MPVGAVGRTKTVGESDVYLFAGLTGDLHRNHTDEEYMRQGRMAGASPTARPCGLHVLPPAPG
jgi:acyl dehydratase